MTNKWQEEREDLCQWPGCNTDSEQHYLEDATKLNKVDIWLCQEHIEGLSGKLFKQPSMLDQEVWLKADGDYKREKVLVVDFLMRDGNIIYLTADDEEIEEDMIEQ